MSRHELGRHRPSVGLLLSHYYFRQSDPDALLAPWRDLDMDLYVFADSGAFSAFTQGEHLSLEGYAHWLEAWWPHLECYSNLDVLGDPDATWINQQALERRSFAPLPVFHCGDDFDAHLAPLLPYYDYVCLGGMVPYLRRAEIIAPWLVRCFELAKGMRTRFHGFGLATWDLLRAFPWRSTDASSGMRLGRYGELKLFDPETCQHLPFYLGDHASVMRAAALIRRYGFEPRQFYDRSCNQAEANWALGLLSFFETGRAIARLHPGYRFYLVLINEDQVGFVRQVLTAYDAHLVNTF